VSGGHGVERVGLGVEGGRGEVLAAARQLRRGQPGGRDVRRDLLNDKSADGLSPRSVSYI
jgi:hypothetical protein